MNAIDLLLKLYDDSWSHSWESVESILKGVTDEESVWQHPAYKEVTANPALPAPGSILWQIAHMEHCARVYAAIIRERPLPAYPDLASSANRTLSDLTNDLDRARAELRSAIAELSEEHLTDPCVGEMNVAEFLAMILRHHTWHAGSIAVARRLWLNR